jgi:regulatory protein
MAGQPGKLGARDRALGWLTRREYAARELANRLLQAGFESDEVEQVVHDLQSQGLQSDDRFAEIFCRHRAGQSYGPLRIRAEMKSRGVEASLVDHHLGLVEVDWFELATDLCRRRYGTEPVPDLKEKARRYRYLSNRGFTSEQVQNAIEQAASGREDENNH